MKKKTIYTMTAVLISMAMIPGCAAQSGAVTEQLSEASGEESRGTADASDKAVEEKDTGSADKASASANKAESTDLSEEAAYPDKEYAEETDSRLSTASAVNYFRTRTDDPDSGDIVDTTVYKIDGKIVKIVKEDYGSDGRIVDEYYYNGDSVAYMRQYKTDIYGIYSVYSEANLGDKEADYTSGLFAEAKKILNDEKSDKGNVILYGYAGDEQGGILANVTVNIRDVAGKRNYETTTDGDGYYSFELPQTDETYNITYSYDGCAVTSLNDVHIVPGTPEYSLGRIFVAPAGQGVHDTDVYLMNINDKSPVKLKSGEYAAVITSDDPSMTLRLVDKEKQKSETGNSIKFDPSKCEAGYALFAEDTANISKDDMAGTMGRTYMRVTVYDESGIKAAYVVPAGRLGTLWKVCDIESNGDLAISGIMYVDTKDWVR